MYREISMEMALGNISGNDRLERKQKRLGINTNIGRPEGFPSNKLNPRRLQTSAIPVSPPVGPPRSTSVPLEILDRLDRLADDEESNVELMNLIGNQTSTKKDVSSELDTDQGEGITQKLKFETLQLNDRILLHISGISDDFSELHTTSEHSQILVNQSDEFPASHKATKPFQQVKENVLLPTQKIIRKQKSKHTKNRYMNLHKIRVICSPPYSPVLPCYPRVPTRILGQVTFNTYRQWYEFVDSPGTEIDLSYVNHNKCYFY